MTKIFYSILLVILLLSQAALLFSIENASYTHHLNAYFQTPESLTIVNLDEGKKHRQNYRITHNSQEYVLRILSGATAIKTRQQEIKASVHAGNLGIGPRVHYVSPQADAILMDFIEGEHVTAPLIQEKQHLSLLLKTIRQLHESSGDFPQGKTVFEMVKEKLKEFIINRPISSEKLNKALEKLEAIEEKFTRQALVPCHHDLHFLNIIKDQEGFKLIDWTDSGMDYAYIDLGFFVLASGIEENQYPEFLSLYLDHIPSDQELALLKAAKEVAKLKIFMTTFSEYEPTVLDKSQRLQRQIEIKQILNDPLLPPLDYFIDLHSKGLVNNKETILSMSLSSLQSFLSS